MCPIKYKGCKPASTKASIAAKGSSRKSNTKPEILLCKALWHSGCRYQKNMSCLPGKPDIVFKGPQVAIFCDGDFWHGNNWDFRRKKLKKGHNAQYWINKIEYNMERDKFNNQALIDRGWIVLRFWESEIKDDVNVVVQKIMKVIKKNLSY